MSIRKLLAFLIQAIIVGLAAAFIVVLTWPELAQRPEVVEVRERPVAAGQSAPPVSYAAAVDAAAPAVVNVYTTKVVTTQAHPLLQDPIFRRFFGDRLPGERKQLQNNLGSGVLISDQGYVLTNNHVIEGADEIQIMLADGRSAAAAVVGTDPDTDLAVLRIRLEALPAIVIGDSTDLSVGDVVLAIGNPFGVGQTVTQGIVSATGRNQLGINTFENFIQTDAAINPGNSGGALVNAHGDLVGINTAIFSRSGGSMGIGFAIPASLAKNVMTQIIEHGSVVRGWLGIEAQDLTPALAESLGLEGTDGVLVAGVLRGGPAHVAGLRPGDVITTIDGAPVTDARAALNHIARVGPGERLALAGRRNGEAFTAEAEVGRRPPTLSR